MQRTLHLPAIASKELEESYAMFQRIIGVKRELFVK
jgi:hypothetical protein